MRPARTKVSPSPAARQLFNVLMARRGRRGKFSSDDLIGLFVERTRGGQTGDFHLVVELFRDGWVEPDGSGGIALAL